MINDYAKVEGYPNLIRDLKTNAIINTDNIELDNYSVAKLKKQKEKQRIDKIESELIGLKSSIEEIKMLLTQIKNES